MKAGLTSRFWEKANRFAVTNDVRQMLKESDTDRSVVVTGRSNWEVYGPLFWPDKRAFGKARRQAYIRRLNEAGFPIHSPTKAEVKEVYRSVCTKLGHLNPETTMTFAERDFLRRLKTHTRLEVRTTTWIGNINVDLFLPALNLAIEIDGKVHDRELKAKKDAFRFSLLQNLGIVVIGIDNGDFAESTVVSLLKNIKRIRRLCSRGKDRLWMRVFLTTIFMHARPETLKKLFGYDSYAVLGEVFVNEVGGDLGSHP